MLHTAASNSTVSVKHLIDLKLQAGLEVVMDGEVKTLAHLLRIKAGVFRVVHCSVSDITVVTVYENEEL